MLKIVPSPEFPTLTKLL